MQPVTGIGVFNTDPGLAAIDLYQAGVFEPGFKLRG